MAENNNVVIKAENIKKNYRMGKVTVEALRGVSLEIRKKEFAIIVGPSGSGKSTLMHILGALDTPTEGSVTINNNKIDEMDEWDLAMLRRKNIGFVFQSFNLIPTLNALENVLIPTEPINKDKEQFLERAVKLLKEVGLGDRMFHKPSELSGGQMQRVSIARALINNPEIVLADEPTGNLDTKTGKKLINHMLKLNKKEGKTFVLVTHDPSLLKYATKTFYLKDGLIEREE